MAARTVRLSALNSVNVMEPVNVRANSMCRRMSCSGPSLPLEGIDRIPFGRALQIRLEGITIHHVDACAKETSYEALQS